jgi:hypothetical protein
MFGVIQTTKGTMATLYSLGPEYSLGAMARGEVEDYAIDSKKLYSRSRNA